jgi:hypothetical protein
MLSSLFQYGTVLAAIPALAASSSVPSHQCWSAETPVCDGQSCFDVGEAWAGHPLTFAIATQGTYQVVGYYDEKRRLVLTERTIGQPFRRSIVIPMNINWDSHNGIAMAIDSRGYVHVAANMHASPMNYFLSQKPNNVMSIVRSNMTDGHYTASVTYPQFFNDASDKLHLLFRFGKSGSGAYVMLSHATKGQWSVGGNRPLIDFGASASPYISGPYRDRNGVYHLGWIVRDTPNASTNHDIFYAKSVDLINWTDSRGHPLTLPIRAGQGELVAPVPKGRGLLNGNVKMGFDRANRPTFLFSMADETGNLDIYSSRLENGAWIVRKALDLHLQWSFQGGGSIENALNIYSPELAGDGVMRASIVVEGKEMSCEVRQEDAALVHCGHPARGVPSVLMQPVSKLPGMRVRTTLASYGGRRYLLRWETLAAARDRAVASVPPPSKLQLFDLNSWSKCQNVVNN